MNNSRTPTWTRNRTNQSKKREQNRPRVPKNLLLTISKCKRLRTEGPVGVRDARNRSHPGTDRAVRKWTVLICRRSTSLISLNVFIAQNTANSWLASGASSSKRSILQMRQSCLRCLASLLTSLTTLNTTSIKLTATRKLMLFTRNSTISAKSTDHSSRECEMRSKARELDGEN